MVVMDDDFVGDDVVGRVGMYEFTCMNSSNV
jgi:hypothetical protein